MEPIRGSLVFGPPFALPTHVTDLVISNLGVQMKKQTIILGTFVALTLAFVQAADASQSFVAKGYSAPIENLISGERFPVESTEITGGLVTINTDDQTVALTVVKDQPCAGKLICPPAGLSGQLSIKLPIQKIDRDHCGVLEYTAAQETTAGRQIITVRDNTESFCRNFINLPKTSVSLVKQTRSGDANALFSAGQLEEIQ